jgi:RNA polymerase sigma factor (sigma-70 family)
VVTAGRDARRVELILDVGSWDGTDGADATPTATSDVSGAGPATAQRGSHGEVEVDLVARRTRDEEFSAFMREARDPLHRMAYLLSGDRHRAEELTQQALERTYRAWSRAREGDPLAYARRVLANLRVDTWRRTWREVLAGPDELSRAAGDGASSPGGGTRASATASGGAGTVDDRDAVVRALLTLPVRQRRVVVMRHLLDLSESEVAAELGVPVGTVKSTASRGLARLRVVLGASPDASTSTTRRAPR